MISRALLPFFALFGLLLAEAAASVEIQEVEFGKARAIGAKEEWLEIAVELEVRRDSADPTRINPDFADRVTVRLALAFERDAGRYGSGAASRFAFYRSQATFVSLEAGSSVARFYPPPEILRRDRLGRLPHSFLVEVRRQGETLDGLASDALGDPATRQSFLERVDQEGPETDGILLPQPETPFVLEHPRTTPAYLKPNPSTKAAE